MIAVAALAGADAAARAAPGQAPTPPSTTGQPRARQGRGAVRGSVAVKRAAGAAASDPSAVLVYLVGFDEPPPTAAVEVQQRGKRFLPNLLGVTVGQQVSFPNGDPFYHNVFSPSSVRKFDLGQYRPGETRSRVFPKTGVVDVYCNIHPQMSATILVLPNRRFAMTRADGNFVIDGVPPGRWTIYAYSRRAEKPVGRPVEVTAGGTTTVDFQVTETRADFSHLNKYGEKYRSGESYR
ncbi:MAG TPA: carboxypeptidase regulatory-like domain-containing protein [Kofleriaceae bacterium]|nr:carboxypeptidase regulatory-like domain-containing protein [Kofleriaceae bacterium]